MTTRGKPLGGKYQNIYQKNLKGGKRHFVVRIRYTNTKGREANKTMSFRTLRKAVAARDRFQSLRRDHRIEHQERSKKMTLGDIAERVLVTKRHLRSYREIVWIINGKNGIVGSFGADFDISTTTELDIEWFKREVLEKRKAQLPKRVKKQGRKIWESLPTQKPLSNRTKNNYLIYLKLILAKAHRLRILQVIPECPLYSINNRRPLKIDLPTFMRVVDAMPKPPKPHGALLLMGIYTAQRWGDLAGMERWQIQGPLVEGTPIAYRCSKTRNDYLQIPMPKLLAEALKELEPFWDDDQPYLFPNSMTKRPYTTMRRTMATACKRLGIEPFEFYQIRHLAATEYLASMGDANAVANILGHRDSRMVDQRYGHLQKRHHPGVTALDKQLLALR